MKLNSKEKWLAREALVFLVSHMSVMGQTEDDLKEEMELIKKLRENEL